jgi:1-deoxy-D-xylulose-5-phosphate synthase
VIGDGAMSAGMAYEAMNNAGAMDANLLVILNDNEMSISPPVGALTNYLARLLSGASTPPRAGERAPAEARRRLGDRAARGGARQGHGHALDAVRGVRLQLHRPIDGHDLDALIPTLQNIKKLNGPQFLHVITRKGQGYKLAEDDPIAYHGPGKFNPARA